MSIVEVTRWRAGFLAACLALSTFQSGWSAQTAKPADLISAIKVNDLDAVKAYVSNGGDPNVFNCRPLFMAYRAKQFEIANYLESVGAIATPRLLYLHWTTEHAQLRIVRETAYLYRKSNPRDPSSAGLFAFIKEISESSDYSKDFWGNPLVYQMGGSELIVGTYGSDGKPGGQGFAKDLFTYTSLEDLEKAAYAADTKSICGIG